MLVPLLCPPPRLAANSFFEVLRPRFCSGKAFARFLARSLGSRRFDSPRFLSGRASTFLIMGPTAVAAISIPSLPQCPASLKKQNICGRNLKFTQMQMLWLELRVAFASSFLLSGNIENESLFQNSVLLESTYGGSSMQ